jgi:hypothetical protein
MFQKSAKTKTDFMGIGFFAAESSLWQKII